MSLFTFKAEYRPGECVTIAALERPGIVTLVRVDEGGIVDCFVSWWDEGKRCCEWLRSQELTKCEGP